jgi:rubrerythrin
VTPIAGVRRIEIAGCGSDANVTYHKQRRKEEAMDWLSFIKIMMMEEEAAQAKYQLAMDMAEDDDMRSFFARLRDEEEFHGQYLEGEYQKLQKRMGVQE